MKVPKFLTSRRSYLRQFERSASGEYVYTGNLYAYSEKNTARRSTLISYWIPAAVMAAASFCQGFLPASGMLNCAYVILPFIAGFLCAVSAVWALVKLSTAKEPLREYVYSATVQVLPVRALFTLVFAVASVIGECVFLLTHGLTEPGKTVLLLVLMLAETAAALLLRKKTKPSRWTLVKKKD